MENKNATHVGRRARWYRVEFDAGGRDDLGNQRTSKHKKTQV